MKKTLMAGACTAALIAMSSQVAQAVDPVVEVDQSVVDTGWYVSMFGGISMPQDMKGVVEYRFFSYATTDVYKTKHYMDNGFILGATVGKSFSDAVRGEIEFSFTRHDQGKKGILETIQGFSGTQYSYGEKSGGIDSYAILANVWYDIENETAFTPYIGGGLGVSFVNSDMKSGPGIGGRMINLDDSDTVFTWQLGAGVNYDVNETVSVGLGYRFRALHDIDLGHKASAGDGFTGVFTSDYEDMDLYSHNVMAHLTFKLNGMGY